ncbi:MAG: 50S ribosomal protein L25/general stress protein Ctc [Brevibacterium sp.]|uniref:50S ribosomal protein L25/general stress protein Ctc n=1 Tax=Brevibacterium sp. TaxID=1701 RepID=UPI0026475E95|nr:50S ribosomal protein L25/general stress protein Ctc [Brevibacterium sp.]MDN5805768.1 50S ribosomal protein L25/general stress protein Ctc [Brevibacterium sp.]MDN5833730.1 50S ribosomal protein L25/general stress protein Ctc [Brevibacterium sp.]MDN5876627.1 50S ribosomal protein L25/general stress protein Ctc [Brevibacterium sp.]MDN5910357.1 50S ribosomal protein L25/general stress protein Ctc [Brevibacterium sp.]MDN6133599.1 50S ribosomal protein L25/general stress protein Ctc [Brevibacter
MADFKLIAEPRNEFGKGAARRTRRAGRIPAVVYGHGGDPVHISVDGHATMMALKHANALFEIESTDGAKNVLAIARDVQTDPVTREIEHLDLIIVKRGEKVEVDVPVHIIGGATPGTMVQQEESTILIKADATKLPEYIEVTVEGRAAGEHVLAGEVELASGVELAADPELLIVNVSEEAEMDTESDAEESEESTEESTEAAAEEKSEDE